MPISGPSITRTGNRWSTIDDATTTDWPHNTNHPASGAPVEGPLDKHSNDGSFIHPLMKVATAALDSDPTRVPASKYYHQRSVLA